MSVVRRNSSAIRFVSILIICSLLLAGCQASKRNTGTALGAVLGGVAGAFFGKGAGKAVAIGLGAVVGGFIGNQIGGYLDEEDQKAVERETAMALSRFKDGQTTTWSNPDSQAEAEITVSKTETIDRKSVV